MFSDADMHMFALTLNQLFQVLIPIATAAGGAWVMHIGHQAGAANADKAAADQTKDK
jgi:hypothetical protein